MGLSIADQDDLRIQTQAIADRRAALVAKNTAIVAETNALVAEQAELIGSILGITAAAPDSTPAEDTAPPVKTDTI